MEVHYISVSQQLDAAILRAAETNREIDYIELTFGEWLRLQNEYAEMSQYHLFGLTRGTYRGVPIKRQS